MVFSPLWFLALHFVTEMSFSPHFYHCKRWWATTCFNLQGPQHHANITSVLYCIWEKCVLHAAFFWCSRDSLFRFLSVGTVLWNQNIMNLHMNLYWAFKMCSSGFKWLWSTVCSPGFLNNSKIHNSYQSFKWVVDGGLEYLSPFPHAFTCLHFLHMPPFPHEETRRDTMALSTLA